MTSIPRRLRVGARLLCLVLTLGGISATAGAATIPANLLALRPVKAVSYQPSPSDNCVWQAQHCTPPTNPAYFDSDFYNADFINLWGSDGTGTGRNDLTTIKAAGVNLLHIYSWNPQRNHKLFLDAANTAGLKVLIPVTNYTACTIVGGGCQGISPASYQTAYGIIQSTFNEIYVNGSKTPHPAAAAWSIFNEYDYNSIDPKNVVFAIQAIMQLEAQAGITAANQLPFVVPVSFGRNTQSASQPAYFASAEALYLAANPGSTDATVPAGVISLIAVSVAMQNAATNNTTSYQAANDTGPVSVAAMPTTFWQNRFIATVNPFVDGPTLNAYVKSASQFQSAFPGTAVTAGGFTWNSVWNSLPPLFFSESGINIGGSAPPGQATVTTQAAFILTQLKCTIPWAIDGTSTTNGYFLGTTIFEFSNEDANGRWGMQVFPSPLSYTTSMTTQNQPYRVDKLSAQPAWASVATGFQATAKTCP